MCAWRGAAMVEKHLELTARAARYSKINLDIVLPCFNIQDNNRYNIYIKFSLQYQDRGVENV